MVAKKSKTPRKRDKEASKSQLLEAGLEIFSKYGYDAATTKMVATRAGLNEQLITRYFGGKSGLLLAILVSFLEKERNDKDHPGPANNVEDEIKNHLLHRHVRMLELRDFLRVIIPRMIIDSSIRDKINPTLLKQGTQMLYDRLSSLRKRGLIRRDIDLEKISASIVSQSMFASFLLPVSAKTDDQYLIDLISEYAKCVARGLAPK